MKKKSVKGVGGGTSSYQPLKNSIFKALNLLFSKTLLYYYYYYYFNFK